MFCFDKSLAGLLQITVARSYNHFRSHMLMKKTKTLLFRAAITLALHIVLVQGLTGLLVVYSNTIQRADIRASPKPSTSWSPGLSLLQVRQWRKQTVNAAIFISKLQIATLSTCFYSNFALRGKSYFSTFKVLSNCKELLPKPRQKRRNLYIMLSLSLL